MCWAFESDITRQCKELRSRYYILFWMVGDCLRRSLDIMRLWTQISPLYWEIKKKKYAGQKKSQRNAHTLATGHIILNKTTWKIAILIEKLVSQKTHNFLPQLVSFLLWLQLRESIEFHNSSEWVCLVMKKMLYARVLNERIENLIVRLVVIYCVYEQYEKPLFLVSFSLYEAVSPQQYHRFLNSTCKTINYTHEACDAYIIYMYFWIGFEKREKKSRMKNGMGKVMLSAYRM